MSTRRAPESDSSSDSRMEKIGARVRQRALTGTEASTVGFVLVGYIGAFSFLGYWLDTHFKTSWIVAVGVLLGAVIGFREMFRMAQKLGRESVVSDAENARKNIARSVMPEAESKTAREVNNPALEEQEAIERKRIFQVPAPPVASFDKSNVEKSRPLPERERTPVDKDDLFEELLNAEDENEEPQK